MRNFIFVLTFPFCFISCDHNEQYEGKWTYDFFNSIDKNFDSPHSLLIKNDSIKFTFWSCFNSEKHLLKIKKGNLIFNGISIKTQKNNDTLILGQVNKFVKYADDDSIQNYLWDKPITRINLPKINNTNLFNTNFETESLEYHILFGKRADNDEYSLQLNDKYAEANDLPAFITVERASIRCELTPFPVAKLYIDKTSPMKFIEDIFYNLKLVNQLKISLVNNINLNFNKTNGLYYRYELLNKGLPYFSENDNYKPKSEINAPPSPPYFPMFDNLALDSKFIILKENRIYFDDNIISPSKLKNLVKPWIENNNVIFSLYDLESTYGSFLEMTVIINSAYQEIREKASQEKFNKSYKDLERDEVYEIKIKNPMHHVWSFSIPHFNHVVENNNSFFGLKIPEMDSASSTE